ncbi:MAG TPA: FAD binding domain-containing protein [Stellaceae bacterium]
MKAIDFDYARPNSVAEVCALLDTAAGDGKILAGGQTLVPLLAMRLARPALLIDINRIAELQGIESRRDEIVVRACTRQATALADEAIRRRLPLLAKALRFVGHVQTRNRGTVGGSLANADPAAEIGLAVMTLGGAIVACSRKGERRIPVAEFFRGAMETALAAGECLTEVHFPVWPDSEGHVGTGFQEVSPRHSDFSVATAAAQVLLDDAGICRRAAIGVGGTDTVPARVDAAAERLLGTRLAEGDIADCAGIAEQAIVTATDFHASAAYRRRLAGDMVRRAVAEARSDALRGST